MRAVRWSVVMGLATGGCTPFTGGQGSATGSVAESTSEPAGSSTTAADPMTSLDVTTTPETSDEPTTTPPTTGDTTATNTTGTSDSGEPEPFFRREIVIHGESIPDGEPLVDFPMLLSSPADGALAHVSEGGNVLDLTGADLVFRDQAMVPLAREIVSYAPSGRTTIWVRVPAIATDADTTIYVDYGAASLIDLSPPDAWNDGYVGAWHFEDTVADGGIILDSSASENHGTAMNMDAGNGVDGHTGRGVSFTQADAAVLIGSGGLDLPGPMTFEGWGRMDGPIATEGFQRLFHKGGTDESPLFMWVGDPSVGLGDITFLVNYTDNFTYGLWHYESIPAFDYGQWHHYAGVVGGPGGETSLFVDGVEISSGTYAEPIWTGYANLYFGNRDTSGPSRQWNGVIDEYRFSSVARSDTWIGASFANQSSPTTFSTVGPEQTLP
jgi:hypothetical protein